MTMDTLPNLIMKLTLTLMLCMRRPFLTSSFSIPRNYVLQNSKFSFGSPTSSTKNAIEEMKASENPLRMSTYDDDASSDVLSETVLPNGELDDSFNCSQTAVAVGSGAITSKRRFESLLDEVGLADQLSCIDEVSNHHSVTCNDVFCNRELNLGKVRAIGFDMDYTIAQYKQPAFDKLAFDGAKEKLVKMGYPSKLLDVEYDHSFWVRGLIIDTAKGNFLKIDRHKYVRVAYHGFTPISSRTRKDLYSRFFNQVPSFGEKQYVNMDTLFQFVDASLFATLVEMKDNDENEFLDFRTYAELYKDVRSCVDLCHRDGVIKDEVARNPEKYIVLDDGLIPMLQKFREDGVKVFLLTNSYWEYTSDAMNYLYHQANVDPELKAENEWTELFDTIVVGSCKPAYLVDPYLNLFRVNPQDGSLLNTDGVFEIEALGENGAQKFLDKGKIFQGGNWKHLTAMLEVEAGEEILYVGDHLYSDVLRSKRTLGWRSMFIMPELPEEMETFYEQRPLQTRINELRNLRDQLSTLGDKICNNADGDAKQKLKNIKKDEALVKAKLKDMLKEYHSAFHPIWGMMFQAGTQDSRLAYFVTNYACLYTSKATNLGLTSTKRAFRTSSGGVPHDRLLADNWSSFD